MKIQDLEIQDAEFHAVKKEIPKKEGVSTDLAIIKDLPSIVPAQGTYSPNISKVHSEFFSSSDKNIVDDEIFDAAKNELTIIKEKAKILTNLGFEKAAENTLIKGFPDNKMSSKYLANEYSRIYYPYKFITYDDILKVCVKYKLIFGASSEYTGFVPPKNLEDIVRFKTTVAPFIDARHPGNKVFVHISHITFYQDSPKLCNKELKSFLRANKGRICIETKYDSSSIGHYDIESYLETLSGRNNNEKKSHINSFSFKMIIGQRDFFIAAPEKDISKKFRKATTFSIFKPKPMLDPIVFYQIKGGFMIVTAWGDEAMDPLIFNPDTN